MDKGSWHCLGGRDQDQLQEKKIPKRLPEEALQIAVKRREAKGNGEKERYTHLNAEFQRILRNDKITFLNEKYKEIGETMGETGEGDGTPL